MASVNAWYGWKPDKPDFRDFKMAIRRPKEIPTLIDLRSGFPPCYDQGDLGSCTANAIAGCMEFDHRKQHHKHPATPSRLFIYYNERVMEGTVSEDAGAEIRDGVKSVNVQGAPPETVWDYNVDKFAQKPSKLAYVRGMSHQALRYARVDSRNIDDLRAVLAEGYPVVFGFTVYDYFESDQLAQNGILLMPKPDEGMQGGHAVVLVGADHVNKNVLVRNSWGTNWGQEGYFWMPYDYITNPDLADDFWVIRQVE